MERSKAGLRELVTSTVLRMIARKYHKGKNETELTEKEVREGLMKLGGMEERAMDEEDFQREIRKILRMDRRKTVRDRIFKLEQDLTTFVIERHLDGGAAVSYTHLTLPTTSRV